MAPIFLVGPMAPRAPFFATVSQMTQCFRRESFPKTASRRGKVELVERDPSKWIQKDHLLTFMMLMLDMNQFPDFPIIKSLFFAIIFNINDIIN